jgi:RNA polymerase sigma factor (sigma-70 family)
MTEPLATSSDSQSSPREFHTTHWSVILAAGGADSPQASAALAKLCRQYWYPLYAFVRRSGHAPADAEDLTQSFFARLLEKRSLSLADPARGRFRTFLLCALKRFLADEWDRARAQKRGGGAAVISLDETTAEGRYRLEPADPLTAEAIYERRWAHAVLDDVLTRLDAEFEADGQAAQFATLKVFIVGDKGEMPFAQAAAALGLTEPAVKAVVHRLRQRYCALVREVVAETVQDPREVEAEIRHLLTVLTT